MQSDYFSMWLISPAATRSARVRFTLLAALIISIVVLAIKTYFAVARAKQQSSSAANARRKQRADPQRHIVIDTTAQDQEKQQEEQQQHHRIAGPLRGLARSLIHTLESTESLDEPVSPTSIFDVATSSNGGSGHYQRVHFPSPPKHDLQQHRRPRSQLAGGQHPSDESTPESPRREAVLLRRQQSTGNINSRLLRDSQNKSQLLNDDDAEAGEEDELVVLARELQHASKLLLKYIDTKACNSSGSTNQHHTVPSYGHHGESRRSLNSAATTTTATYPLLRNNNSSSGSISSSGGAIDGATADSPNGTSIQRYQQQFLMQQHDAWFPRASTADAYSPAQSQFTATNNSSSSSSGVGASGSGNNSATTSLMAGMPRAPSTSSEFDFIQRSTRVGQIKRDLLRNVRPFRKLPEAFFELLVPHMEHLALPQDTVIVGEGEYGDSMYFIASGQVGVRRKHKLLPLASSTSKDNDDDTSQQQQTRQEEKEKECDCDRASASASSASSRGQLIRVLHASQYFGELALIHGTVRFASCIAATPCDLFVLSREPFLEALVEFPEAREAIEEENVKRDVSAHFPIEARSNPAVQRVIDERVVVELERRREQRSAAALSDANIRWTLKTRIGAGACGEVYSAINSASGRPLAVKVVPIRELSKKHVLAVQQESELLQSLRHPNIVEGYGIKMDDSNCYVMMELLPMGSLSGILKECGKLTERTARTYMQQILLGLKYLHDNGVLHRDIKPANILLSETGAIKLADLGVSKLGLRVTTNTLTGTPAYLAPEAINGKYSVQSDVWAMGCTLLEMVTGQVPWSTLDFESHTQLIFHIACSNSAPPMPQRTHRKFSSELHDILTTMLCPCAAGRQTADQLLLHPWLQQQTHAAAAAAASSSSSPLQHSNPTSNAVDEGENGEGRERKAEEQNAEREKSGAFDPGKELQELQLRNDATSAPGGNVISVEYTSSASTTMQTIKE